MKSHELNLRCDAMCKSFFTKANLPDTGQNPDANEFILPLNSKIPEADEWLELCMADEEYDRALTGPLVDPSPIQNKPIKTQFKSKLIIGN
jgi:hypothetical protein